MAEGPSGAPHRTGTLPFMSLGTLRGHNHTYRHDLESFFYVFLWICIAYEGPGKRVKPLPEILENWSTGSYDQIIFLKSGAIRTWDGWMDVEAAFTDYFAGEEIKQIARDMRRTLFGEGGSTIGTPRGDRARDEMYSGMLAALSPK
jgi:Fungal protein kinase